MQRGRFLNRNIVVFRNTIDRAQHTEMESAAHVVVVVVVV
jgi:hypothetical protein